MEILISFLKYSSALDLLVMSLVLLIAVILIPVGIWIAIASRIRKRIYFAERKFYLSTIALSTTRALGTPYRRER